MKECCKTGGLNTPSKLKIWTNRIVWGVVTLLVVGVVLIQLFNL